MLREGQRFFTDIEKEGILLDGAGNTPLAEHKPLSTAEAKAIAQQYFEQWCGGTKEFYIDAQNAYAGTGVQAGGSSAALHNVLIGQCLLKSARSASIRPHYGNNRSEKFRKLKSS